MASDEEVVQHEAERVNIGSFRNRHARGALFGRHICRRSREGVPIGFRPRNGDAEVADTQPVLIDQDICRLEVSVKDALRVRRREARAG